MANQLKTVLSAAALAAALSLVPALASAQTPPGVVGAQSKAVESAVTKGGLEPAQSPKMDTQPAMTKAGDKSGTEKPAPRKSKTKKAKARKPTA